MYEYSAKLIRVIDGDSAWLEVDMGFRMSYRDNFRLEGIDAPEIRGVTDEEKERGRRSKEELERLLTSGTLRIVTSKAGKFGRWIATVYVDDGMSETNVNEHMLNEGFAVPYA